MPGIQRRAPAYYAAAGVEHAANAAGVMDDPALARGLWQRFKTAPELRKGVRPLLAGAAALGGIEGAAKSIKDQYNGERERWMQQTLGAATGKLGGHLGHGHATRSGERRQRDAVRSARENRRRARKRDVRRTPRVAAPAVA